MTNITEVETEWLAVSLVLALMGYAALVANTIRDSDGPAWSVWKWKQVVELGGALGGVLVLVFKVPHAVTLVIAGRILGTVMAFTLTSLLRRERNIIKPKGGEV